MNPESLLESSPQEGKVLLRVLIVGRSQSTEGMRATLLREIPCEVDIFDNLEQATTAIIPAAPPYEIALVEERLLTGDLIARFQAIAQSPEILVAAEAATETLATFVRTGAVQVLRQPILPGELATRVEQAAEHRRLRGMARRAEQLETLHKTALAITSTHERTALLRSILEEAVSLLKAQSGGIYEYYPEREELTVIADYGRPGNRGTTIKVGEGIAGRLVMNGEPYRIVDDYNTWEGRAEIYRNQRPFGSVLEVTLKWREDVIGILYVDDVVSRKFTLEEAELLRLFADPAAIALANSNLLARNQARHERLKNLARATQEIMADLRERDLNERLDLIARHVAEVTEAEVAGVLLVNRPGFLSWEASSGNPRGAFSKGREFAIVSGIGTGLTGHIAHEGKLVNLHGEALNQHSAVRGESTEISLRQCYSLLAIPLKKKIGDQEILVGLLRAENKKDSNGRPHLSLAFTEEDEEIIKIFAEAVVVALELSEQKDWLNRLVASSPDGIIAVDRHAKVTRFNEQAQEILGYSEAEVLGTDVGKLYVNPNEPHKIGKLLHEGQDGKVSGYETAICSKEGVEIPIRHASTWLYNYSGQERIGSVGYFEDLRSIKLVEKRHESLLDAYAIVARAKNLTDGMQSLTTMMASLLPHTFCRILLMEESNEFLRVEAVHVAEGLNLDREELKATLSLPMRIEDWHGLDKKLGASEPYLLRWSRPEDRSVLERLSRWLRISGCIQSLLFSPLRLADKKVGLIELGEIEDEGHRPFTPAEIDFASQIAAHTTALIDRMQLHAIAERRGDLLTALDEASRKIRGEKEMSKLFQELVRLAVALVSCTAGGLFLNRPHLEELELDVTYEIPDQPEWIEGGRNQAHHEGLVGEAAHTSDTRRKLNYDTWEGRDPLFRNLPFKTAVAVPLRSAGEVQAVLFVADASGQQQFSKADLEILERFAAQAATAVHISSLLSPEHRSLGHLKLLHKISDSIQREVDPAKVSHIVLTGITAVYGLAFNRALLLDFDDSSQILSGRDAIGQIEQEEAHKAWEIGRQQGLEDFGSYLKYLHDNSFSPTPLGKEVYKISLPVRALDPDPLSRAVLEQHWQIVSPHDFDDLPKGLKSVLQPKTELVIVPLEAGGHVRGLLIADNKFTRSPITPETIETLITFVNTLSIVMDNRRLLAETTAARERLQACFEASNVIVSSRDPRQVLADVVDQTPRAADASWVRLVLIDQFGNVEDEMVAGWRQPIFSVTQVRQNGFSMKAMHSKEAVKIEDVSRLPLGKSPFLSNNKIAAALCMPLLLHGRSIGVMWINYDRPRRFQKFEIDALQLYVNQAAMAYESARRMANLERLQQSIEFVAHVIASENRSDMLTSIAQSIRLALNCDAVVLFAYDKREDRWSYPPAHDGVKHPELAWPLGGEREISRSIVSALIQRDEPSDISHEEIFQNRRFARDERIVSCVAAPLTAAGQKVGVLFVNYHIRRHFSQESLTNIKLFADQAAVAIRNAQLFEDQLRVLHDFQHQIKNPVNQAYTRTQQIFADFSLDEMLREELATIGSLCAKAKRVSTNIRFFASLIRGEQIPVSHGEFTVKELLQLLLEGAGSTSAMRDPSDQVSFYVDQESFLEFDRCTLWFDQGLVENVVNNVLDNAFKFSYPHTQVRICGGRIDADSVYISIINRGIPILPEEIGKCLDRGWQSPAARSASSEGRGIGLWIVDQIMKAMEGAIEIKSSNPDGDTEVRIILPETGRPEE